MGAATLSTYSADSPVLLVTAFSPAHQGGGAVILRSLIGEPARPEVVWGSLAARERPASGRVAHRVGGRNPWCVRPSALARGIDRLADRHDAVSVWVVAHGPILAAVGPLVRATGRPLHLTVHDDPARAVVFRTRREFALTPLVEAALGDALRAASSVDVVSSGMRAELARRYGVDSIVVHRVLDAPISPNGSYDGTEISVGILGSVYAPRQLSQLLGAVSRASERTGRPGRVVVIGTEDRRLAQRVAPFANVDVRFTGHLPEHEGVEALKRVFALYLGYPFGMRARALRRTSFPTKLATYLMAARPLLVHTPHDSTLTQLLTVAPYAIPWLDDEVESGARALRRAWEDERQHASQHEAADLLRRRYFAADNRARLFAALDRLPRQ